MQREYIALDRYARIRMSGDQLPYMRMRAGNAAPPPVGSAGGDVQHLRVQIAASGNGTCCRARAVVMPNSTLPPMRHANAAQHMMASWARSRSDCVMGVLSPIGWSITSFMNVTVAYSRCRCDEPWKNVDMWMNAWISTAIHIADEPARFLTMWVIRRFWEDYDSVHWYDRAL